VKVIEPYSQATSEVHMMDLANALEAAVEELRIIAEEAAHAEADYKERYWTALLRAERPTVGEREAVAGLYAAKEFRTHRVLAARVSASRDYMRAIQAKIDSLRTIQANVRAIGG
jgi:hypothetical protein